MVWLVISIHIIVFFFQAEDGIRDYKVTGVQTCALPHTTRIHPGVAACSYTPSQIVPQIDTPYSRCTWRSERGYWRPTCSHYGWSSGEGKDNSDNRLERSFREAVPESSCTRSRQCGGTSHSQ